MAELEEMAANTFQDLTCPTADARTEKELPELLQKLSLDSAEAEESRKQEMQQEHLESAEAAEMLPKHAPLVMPASMRGEEEMEEMVEGEGRRGVGSRVCHHMQFAGYWPAHEEALEVVFAIMGSISVSCWRLALSGVKTGRPSRSTTISGCCMTRGRRRTTTTITLGSAPFIWWWKDEALFRFCSFSYSLAQQLMPKTITA